jgi:RNA polymerase sigma-70 factor (ECF subfamily)
MDVEFPQDRSRTPQPGDDDAGLVARVLDGDPAVYDRLVESYQRRAFAVAYRLLGNRDDALEVCQEAFLRGFRSLATLQDPARFGSWLLRIVGNLSLNYRRSRARLVAGSLDEKRLNQADEADAGWTGGLRTPNRPDQNAVAAETHERVLEAMEQLPANQRLALTLFSMNGMSQKEVAEILDCTTESVKWYVFQARKTLKQKLKDVL